VSAPRVAACTAALKVGPLWRIRLARSAPRYLLYAVCAAGLLASLRFAVAPPRATRPAFERPNGVAEDLGAQGFATLFVRRYLTWNAAEPQASASAVEALGGLGAQDLGIELPTKGTERVLWTQVVQERLARPREHVFTVAAETDSEGLVYLTVDVERRPDGRLALAGYPAFVGAPSSASARLAQSGREVSEPLLSRVVSRALGNYLAGSSEELAADLAIGARVSVPGLRLRLDSLERLSWTPDGRSVVALVRATDDRATAYTLDYELDVLRVQGRWEVSAIQMDPST
jgi:Conjugative transposon protein TcpC